MLVLLAKDSINPDDPKIEDDLEKMMREEEKVLSKKKKHKQQRKQQKIDNHIKKQTVSKIIRKDSDEIIAKVKKVKKIVREPSPEYEEEEVVYQARPRNVKDWKKERLYHQQEAPVQRKERPLPEKRIEYVEEE